MQHRKIIQVQYNKYNLFQNKRTGYGPTTHVRHINLDYMYNKKHITNYENTKRCGFCNVFDVQL